MSEADDMPTSSGQNRGHSQGSLGDAWEIEGEVGPPGPRHGFLVAAKSAGLFSGNTTYGHGWVYVDPGEGGGIL